MGENSPIGELIKMLRVKDGYKTQKQLSDASGISQTTLSRIEAGVQKPQPDTLLQLSKYLHSVTYGELMEKSGYLDGLSEIDKILMSEFFNEHAVLDENIEATIKNLSKHDIFPIDVMQKLNSELKPLFDRKKIDMYNCSTPRYLRELIKIIDPDTDFKYDIYKALLRVKNLNNTPHLTIKNHNKVPLLGAIRAGLPILAEENWQEEIEIPSTIKADFALRVEGDSMIYAGIFPGDIVLLKQSNTANTGDIVAAGVEESSWSANLKYFVKPNGHYCLRSANPDYKDIEYTDKHRIIGIMEGLIRENSPSTQEYKTMMNYGDTFRDEWLDVIMEAQSLGLDANKVKQMIEIQKTMIEQLTKK